MLYMLVLLVTWKKGSDIEPDEGKEVKYYINYGTGVGEEMKYHIK